MAKKEYIYKKEKMKELNKKLEEGILKNSNLTKDDVINKDFQEIERNEKIEIRKPKIYFTWEKGEKVGWQINLSKFISEETYKKREKKLNKILKNS
jgi:hypothetical protein